MIRRITIVTGVILLCAVSSNCTGPEKTDLIYQVQALGQSGATADIAYLRAEGDTARVEDETLPWQRNLKTEAGKHVYIWAQSTSPGEVTITVSIFLDGELFRSGKDQGTFVIATASGTVP